MALYVYTKRKITKKKKIFVLFSYITLTLGSLLLFWAFYPIISFEFYTRFLSKNKYFSPIVKSTIIRSPLLFGENKKVLSSNLRDFTQANLWFPTVDKSKEKHLSIKEYTLSIPKLNIKNAKVVVGGKDLSKSLVHYLPHSLPGEEGNVAIFGHSTLPQLYNSKDYKTIFTYLPSLNKGDFIYIDINGIEYEYKVYEIFIVKPEDTEILDDIKGGSFLTLVTCVPPGTFWKRLVVRAKLTHLPE